MTLAQSTFCQFTFSFSQNLDHRPTSWSITPEPWQSKWKNEITVKCKEGIA